MAQRSRTDARQADFFGAASSKPAAPGPRLARQDKPSQKAKLPSPLPADDMGIERDGLDSLAARLSPAELSELVAALPDVALGHLVVVAVRQLRRRLARNNRDAGKGRSPTPLERAARQLIAELGEQGEGDDA